MALATLFLISCQNSDTEAQSSASADSDKLIITEYSDYQCPACGYFHPIVERLKQNMGDDIEFRMRYFPLNSHRYAALAARAAEAARNQGKFYEMHSMLFENQEQWSRSSNPAMAIVNYAREIGLDMNQFTDELNAAETQEAVMQQRQEGVSKGVNSTPTFFIEGEKVDPLPKSYEEFEAIIQKHLEQQQG
ncbi:DsbA family protein [Fodinibius sediminis]|nr:thioredoxin domain-containing protein [Fodinibius sediminis]